MILMIKTIIENTSKNNENDNEEMDIILLFLSFIGIGGGEGIAPSRHSSSPPSTSHLC
jgi:hypothetical protein